MSTAVLLATTGTAHEGRPSVLALFRNPAAARRAIELLEARGVDGDALALAGSAPPRPVHSHEEADRQVVQQAAPATALGGLGGAVLGAAVGAVFAALSIALWPTSLVEDGWIFALVTAWFAAAGSVVGGFIGYARRTGFSDAWNDTFDAAPQPLWLGVFDEEVGAEQLDGIKAVQLLDHPDVEIHRPETPCEPETPRA